jgi:hypothetical protein
MCVGTRVLAVRDRGTDRSVRALPLSPSTNSKGPGTHMGSRPWCFRQYLRGEGLLVDRLAAQRDHEPRARDRQRAQVCGPVRPWATRCLRRNRRRRVSVAVTFTVAHSPLSHSSRVEPVSHRGPRGCAATGVGCHGTAASMHRSTPDINLPIATAPSAGPQQVAQRRVTCATGIAEGAESGPHPTFARRAASRGAARCRSPAVQS